MASPRPWIVLPHDRIEKVEHNLWVVEGNLPNARSPIRRRMVLYRAPDGRLVVINGVCLDEESMQAIDAWGTPAYLVVPNGYHRLDAHAWKQRYPAARVIAIDAATARVSQVVAVEGGLADLPQSPEFEAFVLDGTKGEPAFLIRSGNRATLVLVDALFNQPHQTGFPGFVLRYLLASSGPAKVTPVFRLASMSDRAKFRDHLTRLSATPGLVRVIVNHGRMITSDPAGVLAGAAAAL